MSDTTQLNEWGPGVYEYANGDVLDGGPESSETLPIRQLANRSLYQRLRNVTAWDSTLAAAHGYPAGACVRHGVTTWRAIVDNNVEPGTDPLKWERWGYSESELANWGYSKSESDGRYKNTASLAGNGWHKDTSTGLITQWGTTSVAGAPTGIGSIRFWTINFPIAFPTSAYVCYACPGIGVNPASGPVNDAVEHNIAASGWTATLLNGLALRISGSDAPTDYLNICWSAIGR